MSKVIIVTESTSYIPQAMLAAHPNIHMIPQILIWGNETFRDGVDIQPDEFYKRLKTASVLPSTSQATPKDFTEVFRKYLDQGNEVLAVVISSDLSGTYSSAIQAKEALGDAPVEVIDTRTTAMALGFLALDAAKAAEQGASLAECKQLVLNGMPRTGVVLTVETLEFLHRGGRIGAVSRYLGTALNIKPIIELVDGRLHPLEKVRTRSKAVARLVELVGERTGGKHSLYVSCLHANVPDDARALLRLVEERYQVRQGSVSELSPVVGTHVGPGTLGVVWMVRD